MSGDFPKRRADLSSRLGKRQGTVSGALPTLCSEAKDFEKQVSQILKPFEKSASFSTLDTAFSQIREEYNKRRSKITAIHKHHKDGCIDTVMLRGLWQLYKTQRDFALGQIAEKEKEPKPAPLKREEHLFLDEQNLFIGEEI